MTDVKKITFRTDSFLVTIDGPDGAGKSIFSEVLTREIKKTVPTDRVILVRPTRFDTCPEAENIGVALQKCSDTVKVNSKKHNSFFLKAIEASYRNIIIPAIAFGRLVIVDSSEIRALAFILEKGTIHAKRDTVSQITQGVLTQGIKPSKRIILFGDPDDLSRNLTTKTLNIGDPRSIEEIQKRIQVYKKAIRSIRVAEGDEGVEWIFIRVHHTRRRLLSYLMTLIKENNLISRICPQKLLLINEKGGRNG